MRAFLAVAALALFVLDGLRVSGRHFDPGGFGLAAGLAAVFWPLFAAAF